MSPRQRFAEVALWSALLLQATMLGASVYPRISLKRGARIFWPIT